MFSPDYDALIAALRRVMRALDRSSRRLLIDHGLTAAQRAVLAVLETQPGASSTTLARAAGVGQATLTEMLDRLVARGLVVRTRSTTDRRRVELALTADAERLLRATPVPLPPGFIARYQSLTADERARLVASVATIAELMDDSLEEVADVRHSG